MRARVPLEDADIALDHDRAAIVVDVADERIRLGNYTDDDLQRLRSAAERSWAGS